MTGAPRASVIVRALDEEATVGRALSLLRDQTVEAEIIVVDSGSSDRTTEIAGRWADQVIEIPRDRFSFGRALNLGARAASAPIHFALSAHCFPERADWIQRSLAHYARDDVGGTHGATHLPGGRPIHGVFHQDASHARANPYWGFSNHASSWRASVWERFPFDEEIEAAEDKRWALRVLGQGWLIAVDPEIWVGMSHTWRAGVGDFYRRQKRCARATASFAELPRYRLRDAVRDWWSDIPDSRHPAWLYRLDYRRIAGLAGRRAGEREGRGA